MHAKMDDTLYRLGIREAIEQRTKSRVAFNGWFRCLHKALGDSAARGARNA